MCTIHVIYKYMNTGSHHPQMFTYNMYVQNVHKIYTHMNTHTHTTEWESSHQHHHLTELKEVKVSCQNVATGVSSLVEHE